MSGYEVRLNGCVDYAVVQYEDVSDYKSLFHPSTHVLAAWLTPSTLDRLLGIG
jgi:hypothetical protein